MLRSSSLSSVYSCFFKYLIKSEGENVCFSQMLYCIYVLPKILYLEFDSFCFTDYIMKKATVIMKFSISLSTPNAPAPKIETRCG